VSVVKNLELAGAFSMIGSTATSIILYTDQPLLAEGLAAALAGRPSLRLDWYSQSLSEVTEFVKLNRAGIALLDLTADLSLSGLHRLRQADPLCQVVLWAYTISEALAFQAMQGGVRGILRKCASIESLILDLEAIREGELRFERELLETFLHGKRVVLTPREGQLVAQISQGLKNKEIAFNLGIGEGTVKVYLSRLFKKLGVSDRFELALFGLKSLQAGYSGSERSDSQADLDNTGSGLRALRTVLMSAAQDRPACQETGMNLPPVHTIASPPQSQKLSVVSGLPKP
jgi:two-component system, NarL family, nitrate/nitrite response regulator NarL